MAEHVSEKVHGAPLPGAPEDLGDRLAQPVVGVRDAQPHAREPAGAKAAQELTPERTGLGLADVDPDDLTAATLVDAVGDDQRLVADPTRFADPFDLGVQPQVRISAFQRPLPEDPTCSSSPRHNRETWSLLMPVMPSCSTSRSTRRVETPLT